MNICIIAIRISIQLLAIARIRRLLRGFKRGHSIVISASLQPQYPVATFLNLPAIFAQIYYDFLLSTENVLAVSSGVVLFHVP
jgi:hypothetical protein